MSNTIELAARWRRLFATGIDMLLVPALTLLLVMITGVVEDAEDYGGQGWELQMFLNVFGLAVIAYLLLNGFTLWRRGQTLGKLLLGIAVVRASASDQWTLEPAPLWKLICIRALFFPLLFLIVLPWLALLPAIDQLCIFGKRRRCLHDLASGTAVVRRRTVTHQGNSI